MQMVVSTKISRQQLVSSQFELPSTWAGSFNFIIYLSYVFTQLVHVDYTQLAHPTYLEHEIRANWRLQVAKDAYPYAHSNVRRVGCGRVRGERSMPCIACEEGRGLY